MNVPCITRTKPGSKLDKEPLSPEATTSDTDILDMLEEFTNHDDGEGARADEVSALEGEDTTQEDDVLADGSTILADTDLDIEDNQIELGDAISAEESSELKDLADMLLNDDELGEEPSDLDELDGHWYKDDAELFLCPNCGSFISSAADKCQYCGIVFEADDGEV